MIVNQFNGRRLSDFSRKTRMVQLPATAAIEYVAACCITRTRTITKTKTKTKTRTKIGTITKIVRGPYVRSHQVQYVHAPSGLCVPSNVAWRTCRQKKRQTRPPISAGSRPPLPKFSGYVEVGAHYIFHPSTIWVRPLCTELGPKKPKKNADFAMKQTNICRLSGDINYDLRCTSSCNSTFKQSFLVNY